MEAVSNVSERKLDLILTSPGGSPEAAESIMDYLRSRFDHIRAVVPVAAMSAATMMALACDEILMGTHSQLGPIDPQLTVVTPEGPRSSPAQAILDQFGRAYIEMQGSMIVDRGSHGPAEPGPSGQPNRQQRQQAERKRKK